MDTTDFPTKVQQVVRMLKQGGWTDEQITVRPEATNFGTLYFISAERNSGNLAYSRVSTHVFYSSRKGTRGRIGTSRYDSFGSTREYKGWSGIRSIAFWGF